MFAISICVFIASMGMLLSGIYMISLDEEGSARFHTPGILRYNSHIFFFNKTELVPSLEKIGKKVKRTEFEGLRLAGGLFFIYLAIDLGNTLLLVATLMCYIFTIPIERIGKFATLFGLWIKKEEKNILMKKEAEIYDGIYFLRNLLASRSEQQPGTDLVLEELIRYAKLLKPAYTSMLALIRTNDRREALEGFALSVGGTLSRDYGRLLIQLDEIPLKEVEETLISYQRSMGDIKLTRQKKRDEIISDFIYIPVVFNMILIFLNFINITFFIQQKAMLEGLIS